MFQLTFTIGAPFQDMIDEAFGALGEFVAGFIANEYLSSFICDGIIGGVGGVLTFLPIIILMFLFLSILEDCGYLARAAFTLDKLMHKIVGLHGKAFIPMILGFGCGVPAIMATRTMENEGDRMLAMMLVPFMSLLFIILAVIAVTAHYYRVPAAFGMILSKAFASSYVYMSEAAVIVYDLVFAVITYIAVSTDMSTMHQA